MNNLIFGLVFIFLGLFTLFVSFRSLKSVLRLLKSGERTLAKVVSHVSGVRKRGYFPVFQFFTLQNEAIFYKYTVSDTYSLGDEIVLIYNKDNPKEVILLTFWGKYHIVVLTLIFATITLLIGFLNLSWFVTHS